MSDDLLEMVAVTVDEKEVYTYKRESEQQEPIKTPIGKVVSRVFEGEDVQRHYFVPHGKEYYQTKDEYSLGPTTDQFNFVDHANVLEPLISRGYQLRTTKFSKGGLKLWALLTPQSPLEIPDPISWDEGIWRTGDSLLEAVLVTSSIGPGMGIAYRFGWFRVVCTNGLISEILGLGAGKYTHSNWSAGGVENFLEANRLETNINPVLGTKGGIKRTGEILDALDDKEKRESMLPAPIHKTLQPLTRMPNWYREDLREQFGYLYDQGPNEVTSLDILNAVTSPLNYRNEVQGESRNRQFFSTERLVVPLAQLIAFMSLLD